jgi:hypothetical protein
MIELAPKARGLINKKNAMAAPSIQKFSENNASRGLAMLASITKPNTKPLNISTMPAVIEAAADNSKTGSLPRNAQRRKASNVFGGA